MGCDSETQIQVSENVSRITDIGLKFWAKWLEVVYILSSTDRIPNVFLKYRRKRMCHVSWHHVPLEATLVIFSLPVC